MAYDDDWYLHPRLKPILEATYGVILFQEQVLAIAKELCGYTLGQADVLRRIIGRKQVEKMEPAMKEFVERGVSNGIPKETMNELSRQIVTFAEYSFNQGHSTAYSYLAYQTAYLKAHHPLEFMCALLNSEQMKQEETLPYVAECKKMGIKILPPDFLKSMSKWSIDGDSIRVGINYIKNVGDITIEGKDVSVDFLNFMSYNQHLNKRAIEFMIKAGCFGDYDRKLALDQLEWYKTAVPRQFECITKIEEYDKKCKTKNMDDWIRKLDEVPKMPETPSPLMPWAVWENEALGFSFSEVLDHYDLSKTKKYNPNSKMEQLIGGEIVSTKAWKTSKGKPMMFVTFRTKDESLDLVVFDRLLNRKIPLKGMVCMLSVEDKIIKDFQEIPLVKV